MINKIKKRNIIFSIVMLLPALIFLLLLIGYPLIKVLVDSVFNINLLRPNDKSFTGLNNFSRVISDPKFLLSLKNTIVWTVGSVTGEYILGLGSALLLNKKIKGRAFFRVAIFVPWLLPIIVAGMTWSWLLNMDYGVINYFLTKMHLIDSPINFLGDSKYAMGTVIFINIWRTFPYYTITFLAGLQSIPENLYEAASIDGASKVKQFFHVTLPQLRTISLVIIFMHIIWTSINFDFIWILTQGGPNYSTETIPLMIYRYSMQKFDIGAASALSTMIMIVMTLFFVIYIKAKNRISEEVIN